MGILLVLALQYWSNVPHPGASVLAQVGNDVATLGVHGITLLFVLSGFWITRSLLRDQGQAGALGRFVLRRLGRVLPAYALLLVGFYLAATFLYPRNADLWEPALQDSMPFGFRASCLHNVFLAITGTMDSVWLGPTWAIAVTMQFYLVMVLVTAFVPSRWLPALAGVALIGCWCLRGALHAGDAHVYLSSLTLTGRADSLFLGVLVAWAWEQPAARAWLLHIAPRAVVRRGVIAAGVACLLLFVAGHWGVLASTLFVAGPALAAFACAGVVLEILMRPRGRLARTLTAPVMVFWGRICLFAVLMHQPVNSLLHGLLLGDTPHVTSVAAVVVTFGSVMLVAGLGALSLRWLETPVVVRSRRLAARLARARPMAIPAPEAMPAGYAPPWVRWTRSLGVRAGVRRGSLRVAASTSTRPAQVP